jgi:ribonuclease HII
MTGRDRTRWIVGIDEVGRGALAGPVTVAAAMLAIDTHGRIEHAAFRSLKDSKKLSAAQREFWAKELRHNEGVRFAVARIYPRGIERTNISAAANLAASRALSRLLKDHKVPPGTEVYLDGGLFLYNRIRQEKNISTINAKTVIKADEKITAVAAASVIAKVSRDRFMTRLAARYPQYGFDIHKGYGTVAHRRAIAKNGRCAAHRLTFSVKPPSINR